MKFIQINNENNPAEYIAQTISARIGNDKKVLWLVPGGSAISVAVFASQAIHGVDSNLFISLTDERPGPIDHPDSNWKQLKDSGFNYLTREYYEVLQNQDSAQETVAFAAWLGHFINSVDYRIGFFGVGRDGHTAGILPGCTSPVGEMAAYYEDASRQRISVTPDLISRLDLVVVYAVGEEKRQILELLASGKQTDLPIGYLRAAKELIVYNDLIEL